MKKRTTRKLRKVEQAARIATRGWLILFDLEATCWEPEQPDRIEILEVGAVKITLDPFMAEQAGQSMEFSEVVRPHGYPVLSDFCKRLVPISQSEVDAAAPFPQVYRRFVDWVGDRPFWMASWGSFDRTQLAAECRRHSVALPIRSSGFVDLKREFARWKRVRPAGLKAALEAAGLFMEGQPHRALDDARNLARLTRILLQDHIHT